MTEHKNPEFIYGFHSIEAAVLKAPDNIDSIIIDNRRSDKRLDSLLSNATKLGIKINKVPDLDAYTKTKKNQGVVAILKSSHTTNKLEFKELLTRLDVIDNAIILILDGITDVHNFGAIIRSADCFGVTAIIVPKNNSANISNPVVTKVSSGAVNHIPVITVNNLSSAIEELKKHDFWIAGTALSDTAISLFEFKCNKKLAWVMGSEGSGIRRLVSENCDYLVTIPMYGNTQSLNVSVAAGVVLAYTKFSMNIQS